MELSEIKGVGPKRLELFHQIHIRTMNDLLRFYPKEYLDYTSTTFIRDAQENEKVTLRVTVLSDPTIFYLKGKYIVSVRVSDASGKATLRWMNQPYRMQQVHAGESLYVNGKANRKRGVVFYNPQISKENPGIVPVYPSVKGLTQKLIRDIVALVLSENVIPEILPREWLERYSLMPLIDALSNAHQPKSLSLLEQAKHRLSFDEAVLYLINVEAAKEDQKRKNGFPFRTEGSQQAFYQRISFEPTNAQRRVIDEIERDMKSRSPMNRLVQGDVGSGKTLVAQYALTVAVENRKQGVLIAPTSILAEQHFENLRPYFSHPCLYTGNLSKAERTKALASIESGEADLIVGTHALFSDPVRFADLGLVVTDEQHRFGVVQRAKMEAKGIRPDVLVMSATPIPRTLALLLYADLDLSLIDCMPTGRKPIKTYFVPSNRKDDLYFHIAERAKAGERAYVVCPLIEATEGFEGLSVEEVFREFKTSFPNTTAAMLHGQMRDDEKHRIMEAFRSGAVSILVSTTVVEVGVDVPEATSMVIEGCEHYGLATLHQLRGRVGRGSRQSDCYLLCEKPSVSARERIETMIRTNDGFEIAQRDLEMRGMGDLFGVRQSGDEEKLHALSGCSTEILEIASAAASEVMQLPDAVHNALLEEAKVRYQQAQQIAHN